MGYTSHYYAIYLCLMNQIEDLDGLASSSLILLYICPNSVRYVLFHCFSANLSLWDSLIREWPFVGDMSIIKCFGGVVEIQNNKDNVKHILLIKAPMIAYLCCFSSTYMWFIFLVHSMEEEQMLIHHLSTPTIILTLMLMPLKRLWTGWCCFSFYWLLFSSLQFSKLNIVLMCGLLFRFAQFFINPLMSADATMREIKAVDSG